MVVWVGLMGVVEAVFGVLVVCGGAAAACGVAEVVSHWGVWELFAALRCSSCRHPWGWRERRDVLACVLSFVSASVGVAGVCCAWGLWMSSAGPGLCLQGLSALRAFRVVCGFGAFFVPALLLVHGMWMNAGMR